MSDEADQEARFLRAAERLDRLREAEAAKRPPEVKPAPSEPVSAELRTLRVLSEQECAALREREARWREHQCAAVRERAVTPEAETAWLAQCGVGLRHRELQAHAELVPAPLRCWADRVARGASAILCGPTGSGKSASAIWALRTLYRAGRAEPNGWECASGAFVTASELFALVFEKKPLARFERVDLLVIDDWGMAYETDWPLSVLDRLIDRRWNELRSTIVTTNLTPDLLAERYPRIHSRLCDSAGPGVVVLNRSDLRRAKP